MSRQRRQRWNSARQSAPITHTNPVSGYRRRRKSSVSTVNGDASPASKPVTVIGRLATSLRDCAKRSASGAASLPDFSGFPVIRSTTVATVRAGGVQCR